MSGMATTAGVTALLFRDVSPTLVWDPPTTKDSAVASALGTRMPRDLHLDALVVA